MQGRLSPIINNQIQSFPFGYWQDEFKMLPTLGLNKIEWTLDQYLFDMNPLLDESSNQIKSLKKKYNIEIPALTGDFVMQNPFYKAKRNFEEILQLQLLKVFNKMNIHGIKVFIFPLVDNGLPKGKLHLNKIFSFFKNFNKEIKKLDIQIAFESGFSPKKTIKFIDSLKKIGDYFFLNYDTGNSASFGFNPIEEFNLYNDLILNIHIKDRIFGGSTVPLGNGDTKFKTISKLIDKYQYKKGITLQVARAKNNNHKKVIIDSINFLRGVNIICD